MLDDIDGLMEKYEVDALFLQGKSLLKPDLYYMTRFLSVDSFYFVKIKDQPGILAARDMVCERAKKTSPVKHFHSTNPTINQAISERVTRDEFNRRVIGDIAKHLLPDKARIGIPQRTNAEDVYNLRKIGVKTKPVQGLFLEARETKDSEEIQAIKKASDATEATFRQVIDIIQNCEIGTKQVLFYEKEPLTVGRVKRFIEHALVDNDSENSEEAIVAGGVKGADYHYLGFRSDTLRAHEPIIIDIYPRRLEERYHADITRTVVRGHVSSALRKLFESVEGALNASIDAIQVGRTAEDLVNVMADSFEHDGYPSVNRTPCIREGMLHSLGHGIGLDVHEYPQLSLQPIPLQESSVVALEPALYFQRIGGIRIEDDVIITQKGARTITKLPRTVFV